MNYVCIVIDDEGNADVVCQADTLDSFYDLITDMLEEEVEEGIKESIREHYYGAEEEAG